jgi:hypothetical protein
MAAVLATVLTLGTGIGEPPPPGNGAERALAELGVNDPSGPSPRFVPNGIGIYTGSSEPAFSPAGYWSLTRGGGERGCPWECRAAPNPAGPSV